MGNWGDDSVKVMERDSTWWSTRYSSVDHKLPRAQECCDSFKLMWVRGVCHLTQWHIHNTRKDSRRRTSRCGQVRVCTKSKRRIASYVLGWRLNKNIRCVHGFRVEWSHTELYGSFESYRSELSVVLPICFLKAHGAVHCWCLSIIA